MKKILKDLTPPFLWKMMRPQKSRYAGPYQTWASAQQHSQGYDNPKILEKVKESAIKAKNNEYAFERDSIAFENPQYNWPLLGSLLLCASKNDNSVRVMDIGGSLGSTYYQYRNILKHLRIQWNIVEQKNFVEMGQRLFQDEYLKFYNNLESCLKETKPNFILLASSLQYFEKPYEILSKVLEEKVPYIVFDRTPFFEENEMITVQKVPKRIYEASYPSWIFSSKNFKNFVEKKSYHILSEFDSSEEILACKTPMKYKGFILEHD